MTPFVKTVIYGQTVFSTPDNKLNIEEKMKSSGSKTSWEIVEEEWPDF